jgi:hypothetical protein
MATSADVATPTVEHWHPTPRYDRWLETVDIPIYRDYFIEDLRTLPLGAWDERECNAAMLVLAGQEGVTEARVTEIPPGAATKPLKFSLDEMVYVLEGRGLTTVWSGDETQQKSFEWQQYSLFLLPRNHRCQLSNAQGHQVCRLLHLNALPLAMSVIPEPEHFFDNPKVRPDYDLFAAGAEDYYSEAKLANHGGTRGALWVGNFFPDLRAWDKLRPMRGRGAGGMGASLVIPHTYFRVGLPTMPVGTYKKAHWHGPGIVIVVPGGSEGFSFMWPEGEEKHLIHWGEGSAFVPPNRWWHQHFNAGSNPARYLTLHPPRHPMFGGGRRGKEAVNEPDIEYVDEDPLIRQTFEAELRKHGVESLMPEAAYHDRNFEWKYTGDPE